MTGLPATEVQHCPTQLLTPVKSTLVEAEPAGPAPSLAPAVGSEVGIENVTDGGNWSSTSL